jgi:hypothetical protein
MSSILSSLSHEIESTYIDAEIEAECYQENWYEVDTDLKEKVIDMIVENSLEQF